MKHHISRQQERTFWVVACLAVGVSVATTMGCGDPNGRQTISGEITLNGEPLPMGEVSLRPFDTGPSAAGRIEDGRFKLSSDKGPLPGKYLVEIQSVQPTGKSVRLAGTSLEVDETEQVVPEEYNENSQLVIEVTGSGENHYKFDLKKE